MLAARSERVADGEAAFTQILVSAKETAKSPAVYPTHATQVAFNQWVLLKSCWCFSFLLTGVSKSGSEEHISAGTTK